MYYWRLRVAACRGGEYDVYYKTPIHLTKENVARHAVIDGDLLDVFLPYVDLIEAISAEIYFEHNQIRWVRLPRAASKGICNYCVCKNIGKESKKIPKNKNLF
jgi:hypothetical protein